MKVVSSPRLAVALVALGLSCPPLASAQSNAQKPAATPARAPAPAASRDEAPERLFKAWDQDHDGSLSEQEFVEGWDRVRDRVRAGQQRLRAQFEAADANQDGAIDATEYARLQVVRNAGQPAPPLQAFDANRDQRLQFAEYIAMLERIARAMQQPAQPASAAPTPPAKP